MREIKNWGWERDYIGIEMVFNSVVSILRHKVKQLSLARKGFPITRAPKPLA